jgi:hypothetical protein
MACGGGVPPNTGEETVSSVQQEVIPPPKVKFEKLFSCDGGASYVDVNVEERRYLQLVIRDPRILGFLQQTGAASLPFGATEATYQGFTGVTLKENSGPKLDRNPYGGPGVFAAQDFVHFIAGYLRGVFLGGEDPLVNIYREGNGLTVVWGTIVSEECVWHSYNPDTQTSSCGRYRTWFKKRADWHFLSCDFGDE